MKPEETQVYIGVGAQDTTTPPPLWGKQLQLLYRLDANLMLLQASTCPPTLQRQGNMMTIDCQTIQVQGDVTHFCKQVLQQVGKYNYAGICLLFPFTQSGQLPHIITQLGQECATHGLDFLLPEEYGTLVKHSRILLTTQLTGGTLEGRFRTAIETYGAKRIVMDMECMGEDFLLPAPKGCGNPLSLPEIQQRITQEQAHVFFSHELCAKYFTYQNKEHSLHFVLFDDAHTLREKISCAKKWGLGGVATTWAQVEHWQLFQP